ncbi:hypothetical protein GBA52_000060 [Prunus armeniaca]|nr:hypothetical protein GBA52_000060 [Prunus armeniaca]
MGIRDRNDSRASRAEILSQSAVMKATEAQEGSRLRVTWSHQKIGSLLGRETRKLYIIRNFC